MLPDKLKRYSLQRYQPVAKHKDSFHNNVGLGLRWSRFFREAALFLCLYYCHSEHSEESVEQFMQSFEIFRYAQNDKKGLIAHIYKLQRLAKIFAAA